MGDTYETIVSAILRDHPTVVAVTILRGGELGPPSFQVTLAFETGASTTDRDHIRSDVTAYIADRIRADEAVRVD